MRYETNAVHLCSLQGAITFKAWMICLRINHPGEMTAIWQTTALSSKLLILIIPHADAVTYKTPCRVVKKFNTELSSASAVCWQNSKIFKQGAIETSKHLSCKWGRGKVARVYINVQIITFEMSKTRECVLLEDNNSVIVTKPDSFPITADVFYQSQSSMLAVYFLKNIKSYFFSI